MRKTWAILALTIVFSAAFEAQTRNAKLIGTVTDESKAFIPGARISLVDRQTRAAFSMMSSASGEFRFEVPAGRYDIAAELTGFETFRLSDVELKANDLVKIPALTLRLRIYHNYGYPLPPPQDVRPRYIPLSGPS
jgi:hypothetical protein